MKLLRKQKHMRFLTNQITELEYELINDVLELTKGKPKRTSCLITKAKLIRKYQRRLWITKL